MGRIINYRINIDRFVRIMVNITNALEEVKNDSPVSIEDTYVLFASNSRNNLRYMVYGFPRYSNGYVDGEDWVFESDHTNLAVPKDLRLVLPANQFLQIVHYYYECYEMNDRDYKKYGDLQLLDIRLGIEMTSRHAYNLRNVAFACKNTETEEYTLFTYEL